MGSDVTAMTLNPSGGGFQSNCIKKVIVRSSLLSGIYRKPQGGDDCLLKFNLETDAVKRTISKTNGVTNHNGILLELTFEDLNQSA